MKASEPVKMSGSSHLPLSAAAQLWMELGEGMVRAPGKVEEAGQLSQIQRAAQIGGMPSALRPSGRRPEGLLQGLRTEEGGERFVVEQALVQPRIARVEMAG